MRVCHQTKRHCLVCSCAAADRYEDEPPRAEEAALSSAVGPFIAAACKKWYSECFVCSTEVVKRSCNRLCQSACEP
eukprot:3099444-Amphidinium_carterae.1